MSRIGKQPILIPDNVEVTIDGGRIFAKGPKGEVFMDAHPEISVEKDKGVILVKPERHSKNVSALWGLTRALIANMIQGVREGYVKKLEIEGVGYRVEVRGKNILMQLGFSHPINFQIPENISVNAEGNKIEVAGVDKQLVGQVAAQIRSFRKPEPYKGKGIHYAGEHIRRKAGKKAATAA